MPTTSPYRFISGPPELPGLMEASTWIMLKGVPSTLMARSQQDTMPWLMEKVSSPRGLPMASTESPTFTLLLLPRVTGCRSVALIFSTATS